MTSLKESRAQSGSIFINWLSLGQWIWIDLKRLFHPSNQMKSLLIRYFLLTMSLFSTLPAHTRCASSATSGAISPHKFGWRMVVFPFLNPCLKEHTIQCTDGKIQTNSLICEIIKQSLGKLSRYRPPKYFFMNCATVFLCSSRLVERCFQKRQRPQS